MLSRILTRIAARILSKRAQRSAHDRIIQRTVELQRAMGWPDDPRLRA